MKAISVYLIHFDEDTFKNLHIIERECGEMFTEILFLFNENFCKEEIEMLK